MKRACVYGLMLVTILLSGCGGSEYIEKSKKSMKLDETLRVYESAVRWGKFDLVYSFGKLEPGERIELPANLSEIRVTRYNVMSPPYAEDEKTVSQTVDIRYVNVDYQIERSIQDDQVWEYDEELVRWYRISPVPEFR
jgi:hypothetical protein